MYNPFFKYTKLQKEAIAEHRHSPGVSLFYGIIILTATLFTFSLHFEFRLIDVLSKSSLRDDTNTLSRFDKYMIKRKSDEMNDKHQVNFAYQITDEDIDLPRLAKPTLLVRIQPKDQFIAVYLPSKHKKHEVFLEEYLHSCLFTQGRGLKTCFLNTIQIFEQNAETYTQNPFDINKKPYTYSDKFSHTTF